MFRGRVHWACENTGYLGRQRQKFHCQFQNWDVLVLVTGSDRAEQETKIHESFVWSFQRLYEQRYARAIRRKRHRLVRELQRWRPNKQRQSDIRQNLRLWYEVSLNDVDKLYAVSGLTGGVVNKFLASYRNSTATDIMPILCKCSNEVVDTSLFVDF